MLVHVNNHDDSRLVPEREEGRDSVADMRSNTFRNPSKHFSRLLIICIRRQAERGLWFLADAVGSLTTGRDQYRAAEVFERILHIIQILLESDLLCDRCTVQTAAAAALRVNAVGAALDIDADSHRSGSPVKLWGGWNWISSSSLRTSVW